MAVVRNDDQDARILAQVILQPVNGVEVQVVGRLVEQQRRGVAEERLRQEDADFLAALHLAHLALVQRGFDVQAVQQDPGVGLGRVSALVADNSFQLAEAHAVLVGQLVVRLGVKRFTFLQRLPKRAVAHDDGIDHAKFVKGELVLPQNAHLLGPADGSLGRIEVALQDLHQGGLSGTIRAGDRIAAPFHERAGDVLEENPRAVAHGDVI